MARIHDIGKIYIPDDILKSSDKLTPEEYEEVKKHSQYGYDLLSNIDILKRDLKVIFYHHEHYDGTGYPEGKSGKSIPIGARILAVCDALDVMITGRTYKPPLSKVEIIQELKDCSGTQFDPYIAEIVIKLINKGRFNDVFIEFNKKEDKNIQLTLNINKVEE
jgi:HD-GYP domain-containing protein (c-di-GMP phosphodiesterase class II)